MKPPQAQGKEGGLEMDKIVDGHLAPWRGGCENGLRFRFPGNPVGMSESSIPRQLDCFLCSGSQGPGSGGSSALTKRPTLLPHSPPDGSSYPRWQHIP